jgi:NAD(P)-dependent dehydrogenase (short-subunit alcohol dehydrogenase family)
VMGGRREEQDRKLAESLGEAATFARTDVAAEADVKALIEMAARRFGRLDCLVNNVGIRERVAQLRAGLAASERRRPRGRAGLRAARLPPGRPRSGGCPEMAVM